MDGTLEKQLSWNLCNKSKFTWIGNYPLFIVTFCTKGRLILMHRNENHFSTTKVSLERFWNCQSWSPRQGYLLLHFMMEFAEWHNSGGNHCKNKELWPVTAYESECSFLWLLFTHKNAYSDSLFCNWSHFINDGN
jgi:hypothetical protein